MKILHLLYESKGDPFGIGGVGIRAYEIYKHLKDRHEITLLCKKYMGANDGEVDGLRHVFVGTEDMRLTKTLLSYAYHAAQFVKRHSHEYDIIIEEFSPAIPTFLHAFTRKPVVLQIQGYTGKLYFRKYNPFYASALYSMELLRPGFYDNFIFLCLETAEKLCLREGRCVEVIPNGVALEAFDIPSGEGEYILYFGRIDIYGKGLDTLIDAYNEFYESFSNIKLVIAGDGRDREKFRTMREKLPENVRKNIELLGWVSGDKKRDVLSRALFAIFPSRHEVQPIAALEAMAAEKPIIVSAISEFRFATNSGAGISFKTGDALSLARSMKELMIGDDRKEMGQWGRKWVREFTWDKIALKYEGFLHNVLMRCN